MICALVTGRVKVRYPSSEYKFLYVLMHITTKDDIESATILIRYGNIIITENSTKGGIFSLKNKDDEKTTDVASDKRITTDIIRKVYFISYFKSFTDI